MARSSPLSRGISRILSLHEPNTQDRDALLTALSEANLRVQVENICQNDVIRNAWAHAKAETESTGVRGGEPEQNKVYVHGWIYELQSGRLRDLGVSQRPEGWVCPKFGMNG